MGPALKVTGLTKTFGLQPVLMNLDLEIQPGEVHALVGENGSGKSTTIKILSGYHVPDPGGEVLIEGKPLSFGSPDSSYAAGLRFVHQDLGLVETSSVLDNMALTAGFPCLFGTIRSRLARRMASVELNRVGLDIDPRRMVADLSPSAKTGVAIARALRDDPGAPVKVLVLDEPTATLPMSEVETLLSIVREAASHGVAVLYVTHRIDEIFEVTQMITVLRDGRPVATTPTSSLDRAGLIHLLIGRELEEIDATSKEIGRGGEVLVRVSGLSAGPLRSISFEARRGEVVGIAGITGSGRELVLAAIFGAVKRKAGTIEIDGVALGASSPRESMAQGISYVPPDRKSQGFVLEHSARENMSLTDLDRFWRFPFLHGKEEVDEAARWFEELDVRPAGKIELPIGTFSGGNQQKVLFAKWLRRRPRVLMLDEPTHGVDIGAKAELHRRVLETAREGAAVLVTSVDVDELVALSQRVLVLRHGEIVAELSGDDLTFNNVASTSLAGEVEAIL